MWEEGIDEGGELFVCLFGCMLVSLLHESYVLLLVALILQSDCWIGVLACWCGRKETMKGEVCLFLFFALCFLLELRVLLSAVLILWYW